MMTSYKKYDRVYYSEDGSTVTYSVKCVSRLCSQCMLIFDDYCPLCGARVIQASMSSGYITRCKCGAELRACWIRSRYGVPHPPITQCSVSTGIVVEDDDAI